MEIPRLAHYLAGEWVASAANGWHPDVNPSTGNEILAEVPDGGPAVVDRAAAAAQAAFRSWASLPGAQRANVLYQTAQVLAERRQELGLLVAQEVGKPIGEAIQEVDRGVVILRYFAGEAVHPLGSVIPAQQAGSLQFTLRQPLGPVAVISPWNFPVAIPLWKIAPALAFGNTVIWKPAEVASAVATSLVQAFAAAGLPAGVLNLVLGKGSTTGSPLVAHTGVRAITFTGSNAVGMGIAEIAAKRNIKYQLEMGGKNATIVLADADLDQAARLIASGAMRYAGQKCTATSRTIVAEAVLEPFLERLKAVTSTLPLGPATDAATAIGPLIAPDAVERVRGYAMSGAASGTLIMGGKAPEEERFGQGFFFEPTILVGVPSDAPVAQEEVFGPLLVVQPARSLEDAIALANGTSYGLSVSLFTRNLNAILAYLPTIECGMVRVNGDTTGVDPHAPFGGMRNSSSHSREQGPAAIEFFTEIKTVQINPAGD
jgi:acyl-CoA reductase-like NAD-dependent aldehyde dehydrogenase